jgi:hypothetical protein
MLLGRAVYVLGLLHLARPEKRSLIKAILVNKGSLAESGAQDKHGHSLLYIHAE